MNIMRNMNTCLSVVAVSVELLWMMSNSNSNTLL